MKKIVAILGIAMILCSLLIIPVSALENNDYIEPYIPLGVRFVTANERYDIDAGNTVVNVGDTIGDSRDHYYPTGSQNEGSYMVKETISDINAIGGNVGYYGSIKYTMSHRTISTVEKDLRLEGFYTDTSVIIDTEKNPFYSGVIKDIHWNTRDTNSDKRVRYYFELTYIKHNGQRWEQRNEIIEVIVTAESGNVYVVPQEVIDAIKERTPYRYAMVRSYYIQPYLSSTVFKARESGVIEYQFNFANNGNALRKNGFQKEYMSNYQRQIVTQMNGIKTRVDVSDFDFSNFIVDGVGGFMTQPLFGEFTIGGLMAVVLGIGLCLVLIKIYLGG